jgi:hypothetical protein
VRRLGRKRGRVSQTKHDRKVASIAKNYERKGWKVRADLPGYQKPKPIGKSKRIPDVIATRPGTRHIVEVETKDTLESHKRQQSTFRRSASQRNRTKYREEVAK